MGFNPRLAPYSIEKSVQVRVNSAAAGDGQEHPIFKFPFAGQMVGAFANVRRISPTGVAVDAAIAADTTTAIPQVSLWKHATDDTTATYATGLRAAKRTGVAGVIAWDLPTTTAIRGFYTLTNQTAARRKFGAGDAVLVHVDVTGATDAHRAFQVDLQMDYIIGHEAS